MIHCDNCIREFQGEFRFLSNFWPVTVRLEGETFPSVEHAYQAAKTLSPLERQKIRAVPSPGQAKRLGRTLTALRPDWDNIKVLIMLSLVRQKFSIPDLGRRLLETGSAALQEGNPGHDRLWGICHCPRCGGQGQNQLGKILEQVRAELVDKLPSAAAITRVIRNCDRKYTADEVYIGRPGHGEAGPFGNPIKKGHRCHECGKMHMTAESTLSCYKQWLWKKLKSDPVYCANVRALYGRTLVCFCKPAPCHGDVLAAAATYLQDQNPF